MDFPGKIKLIIGHIISFLRNVFQGAKQYFLDFFPDRKRRIIVGAAAGVLVVLIFTAALLSGNSGKQERPRSGTETYDRLAGSQIPVEDLFLPDEPDFIPGVLLERDRRLSWTIEDASEYWQDPLKYGEEQWRQKIEAVIDDYMERVP